MFSVSSTIEPFIKVFLRNYELCQTLCRGTYVVNSRENVYVQILFRYRYYRINETANMFTAHSKIFRRLSLLLNINEEAEAGLIFNQT